MCSGLVFGAGAFGEVRGCNEMQSQRSAAKEQLSKVEAKLLEVEERNRQLAEQTNDVLAKKMNHCLCDFEIRQIKTQK